MKKRSISLALALTLVAALLTGCVGKKPASGNVDLAAFYATLAEKYESFSSHAPVEGDVKTNYYPGLDDIALTQEVLYSPRMSSVVSDIALVEVTDEADVPKVKDIFQARIDTQVNGGAWYPESIQTWVDHAKIVDNGKYVMLVAEEDSDAIVKEFYYLFDMEVPTDLPVEAPTESVQPDGTEAPTDAPEASDTPALKPVETAAPSPSAKPSASPKPSPTPSAKPSPSPSAAPETVKLDEFYAAMIGSHEFAELTLADQAILDNLYAGLSGVATKQCLVYVNPMTFNMGEFALIEVSDGKDVEAVKDALQSRIDYMVGDGNGPGGASYPMAMDQWENCSRVVSNGNYVMMVVHEECDAIVESFNALFA